MTFFGLGPNYRPILHDQILYLLDLSEGKLTWTEIYNMPIWLRKMYILRYTNKYNNNQSPNFDVNSLKETGDMIIKKSTKNKVNTIKR